MVLRKISKNIMQLKKYNIPISLKFVISKLNYKDIMKVYKLSQKIHCTLNLKPVETVQNYYHRAIKFNALSLTPKDTMLIENILEEICAQEFIANKKLSLFFLRCIQRLFKEGNLNFIKKCLTPKYSIFITCHGEIYNCLYQESIGNLKDWPHIDWNKATKIFQLASRGKCPKCLAYHGYLREFNLPQTS